MPARQPAELVLTARAGTPLGEIEATLAANGQELAFEPLDHSAIYHHAPRVGTIGGTVAVNASGPRRIKAGIGLKLCTAEGLAERHVARRDGPAYKACRKLGWGDGLMAEQLTEFDQ